MKSYKTLQAAARKIQMFQNKIRGMGVVQAELYTTVAPDIGVPSASLAVTATLALAPAAIVVDATPFTRIVEVPGSAVKADR